MNERKSYSTYINIALSILIILVFQLMVLFVAPALRYRIEIRESLKNVQTTYGYADCEFQYALALNEPQSYAFCKQQNREVFIAYDSEARLIAFKDLSLNQYDINIHTYKTSLDLDENTQISLIYTQDAWMLHVHSDLEEYVLTLDTLELVWRIRLQ